MPQTNEARIEETMKAEGLDYMQARNVVRAQDAMHNALRANPRHADYRFGREF